jgi:hypothetical protein
MGEALVVHWDVDNGVLVASGALRAFLEGFSDGNGAK